MLKKTVTFEDFDDNQQTEDLYFNLTKFELLKLDAEFGGDGGFSEHLTKVAKSGDGKLIMSTFEDLISRTYGVRSADGRSFHKGDTYWEAFKESAAFDAFFLSIVTDPDEAAIFVNGIMPSDLVKAAREAEMSPRERSEAQMQGFNQKVIQEPIETNRVEIVSGQPNATLTIEQLQSMSVEEIIAHKNQHPNR